MTNAYQWPMVRRLQRFFRTPKGLLMAIFTGLLAASMIKLGAAEPATRVAVAAVTAAGIDLVLTYWRRRRWILPDGAILTGAIIAFILRPQEGWIILTGTVALAIASKHALRTHWSNIFNPAALALVVAAIVLRTGQDWWGALPDLGIVGALVVLAAGAFIAGRINKLPMVLAFFGVYFTLFTVASLFRSSTVAETFLTPDLQAAIFFAFFMLDDPPTSPVRYEDQVVFGAIVAGVSYVVFMLFGGVYFLPAGLLVGNAWESGRRLVMDRARYGVRGRIMAGILAQRRIRLAGSVGAAVVALPLAFSSGVLATGGAHTVVSSAPAEAPSQAAAAPAAASPSPAAADPFPFLPDFTDDLTGNYTQTSEATGAHLVLDGVTTGDLALSFHVELVQSKAVPTPDQEGAESTSDNEADETRPRVTTTSNIAQLIDPVSKRVLCDGKLTALGRRAMRLTCDGADAYAGVTMQISGDLDASEDGTFTGSLSGVMQRVR